MTIYFDKARKKYRYNFRLDGIRYSGYCLDFETGTPAKTKTEAKAIEQHHRVAAQKGRRRPINVQAGYSIAQCFADWLDSIEGTANFHNAADHVAEFLDRPEFQPEKLASDITDQDVEAYIRWAKKQKLRIWIGGPDRARAARLPSERRWKLSQQIRSPSTVNHYLASLRSALNRAHRSRDPASRLPLVADMPTIPKLSVPELLPRPISDADITRIVKECCRATASSHRTYRKHLAHAILLCRMMPFRKAEVFNLRRSGVDHQNEGYFLPAAETKAKRDEFIPASPQAMKLLRWLDRRAEQLGQDHLILYREPDGTFRPVRDAKSAWRAVRKALGLRHVFHNTKASYVTAVGRNASGPVTQAAARHVDYKTTQRYLKIIDRDRRAAADSAGFTAPTRPSDTQKLHTPESGARKTVVK